MGIDSKLKMDQGTTLNFGEARPNPLIGVLSAVGFVAGVALSIAACVVAENGYPFVVALAYLLPIIAVVFSVAASPRWAAIMLGIFVANLIGAPIILKRSGKLDHVELLMSCLGAGLYGVAGFLFLWKGPNMHKSSGSGLI